MTGRRRFSAGALKPLSLFDASRRAFFSHLPSLPRRIATAIRRTFQRRLFDVILAAEREESDKGERKGVNRHTLVRSLCWFRARWFFLLLLFFHAPLPFFSPSSRLFSPSPPSPPSPAGTERKQRRRRTSVGGRWKTLRR